MVNEHDENTEVEIEPTNMEDEIELEDIELKSADKVKQLKKKLQTSEDEKKSLQDELQRARADFLNAKKRLEDEKAIDRTRAKMRHVEELLPLCDSFHMAMSNKEVWEKTDKIWRTGIEGINNQLTKIIESYGVTTMTPIGEPFNPHKHEAIGTQPVATKDEQDIVQVVMQNGYEMKVGDRTEIIRPARVITGDFEN